MKQDEVEELVAKLYEHFDCVQVMASLNENGECVTVYSGAGNWHGRVGMAKEFLDADCANTWNRRNQEMQWDMMEVERDDEGDELEGYE